MDKISLRSSRRAAIVGISTTLVAAALAIGPMAGATSPSSSLKSVAARAGLVKKTTTPAADLRVALNALYRQHVHLAANAVRRGFDGTSDFSAAAAALDKNSVALSKAVGSVYGAAAEKRFLDIWRSHIGFFVDYTLAAKKGDKAGMDKAVQNLGGYQEGIAQFLSEANPYLTADAVKKLVGDHIGHLKGAVDAYGAGKYDDSYDMELRAEKQIGTIADGVTAAIVRQFPAKFAGTGQKLEEKMEKKTEKMEQKIEKTEKKLEALKEKASAVMISDFTFGPATLKVKKGTTVTWTNKDSARHNVTADSGTGPSGPLLSKGESYSYTFNTVGTFPYHCEPHPFMKGTVEVSE